MLNGASTTEYNRPRSNRWLLLLLLALALHVGCEEKQKLLTDDSLLLLLLLHFRLHPCADQICTELGLPHGNRQSTVDVR